MSYRENNVWHHSVSQKPQTQVYLVPRATELEAKTRKNMLKHGVFLINLKILSLWATFKTV